MIDTKSDPGAWRDLITIGAIRAVDYAQRPDAKNHHAVALGSPYRASVKAKKLEMARAIRRELGLPALQILE